MSRTKQRIKLSIYEEKKKGRYQLHAYRYSTPTSVFLAQSVYVTSGSMEHCREVLEECRGLTFSQIMKVRKSIVRIKGGKEDDGSNKK